MKSIRLDKYLCDLSLGTRSEVKDYIKKGRVRIDDRIAKRPEEKVSDREKVTLDGRLLIFEEYEYYMFYKPAGCVSATEDRVHETVLDYIDSSRKDLFPVGRLDIDTEGLLIITNDGIMAHNLLSPKKMVTKTYYARIDGEVSEQDIRAFQEGLDIGDEKPTMPAELEIIEKGKESEIYVTLTEGRFHEVKRMFEAIGREVLYLKRISMGPIELDKVLKPGEYRKLTEAELEALKKL